MNIYEIDLLLNCSKHHTNDLLQTYKSPQGKAFHGVVPGFELIETFSSVGIFVFMRSTIFLPIGLIKEAQSDGWLRSLAYYVRLKSLYKNNTHYNFSLRSLGERMGCSPACLAHHLRELGKHDLIRRHSRNMTFIGARKLQSKYGLKMIGVPVDRNNQLELLRAQLIRLNLGNQAYNIHKNGIQKRLSGNIPTHIKERFYSCYVGLSCIGFGKILGLSPASGMRIRRRLVEKGILGQTRRYSILKKGATVNEMRAAKIAGAIPIFAKLVKGNIVVERRSQLKYLLPVVS